MSTMLTIPKPEMSMSEGTLAEWKVEDGASVNEGDLRSRNRQDFAGYQGADHGQADHQGRSRRDV